jgi:hypothetical protein
VSPGGYGGATSPFGRFLFEGLLVFGLIVFDVVLVLTLLGLLVVDDRMSAKSRPTMMPMVRLMSAGSFDLR